MTPAEFILTAILGVIGLLSVLLLLLIVAASLVRRELDDYAFRKSLLDATAADDTRVPEPPVRHRSENHASRLHSRSRAAFPERR